jgi:hypothetical protein
LPAAVEAISGWWGKEAADLMWGAWGQRSDHDTTVTILLLHGEFQTYSFYVTIVMVINSVGPD